jgi:predicted nucleotidyltransferase component of viral defense system
VLNLIGQLPVEFYLTGDTALSRAFLHHRYSDDLDFFLNDAPDFKQQFKIVIDALSASGQEFDISTAGDGFARIFIPQRECTLKLDFVNDVPFRSGTPSGTSLFIRTDNILNILSNKLTALNRYASKDVVDIVFICETTQFNWINIFDDVSKKDLWVNPVNTAEILEQFPAEKLEEIIWAGEIPSNDWLLSRIKRIIPDILDGKSNSLFKPE